MSSDCDKALESLYLYLDAELDAASAEQIRSHLEDCSGCIHSFEFEKRLKLVIRQRLDEEVPDAFVARLRTALAREAAGNTQ